MARRKKTRPLEDLLEFFSLLPWWVGLAVALLAYIFLHHVAVQPLTPMTQLNQMRTMVTRTIWHTAASIGQYVLPLVACVGAAMSAIGRRKRHQLMENAAVSPASNVLNDMSWREFELLVGEAFRQQGYKVTENSGGTDGGIDLTLRKDGEIFLV